MNLKRQPSFYITHGAGPCFWMDFPPPLGPHAFDKLESYFKNFLSHLPQRPDAIIVVSAHWEEAVPTISSALHPPMLFDYYGFPEHTFQLSYPAKGHPSLSNKIENLLDAAGFRCQMDSVRGFDHGVFVPMMKIDEKAEIPVVMLSLQKNLDPDFHFKMGQALAPLCDENIVIIGSGSSYHNLRHFMDGKSEDAIAFDDWLLDAMTTQDINLRRENLLGWEEAPKARICHPRSEHLLPLMVVAGAGYQQQSVTRSFYDLIGNKPFSCFQFG